MIGYFILKNVFAGIGGYNLARPRRPLLAALFLGLMVGMVLAETGIKL